MRFAILGPLDVSDDTGSVSLTAPKQRLLLAILICRAGRPVSPDRLIELLWEDPPPDRARKALAWHVMQLRQAIGGKDRIRWHPNGYQLVSEPDETDAEQFRRLYRAGNAALSDGDDARAHDLLFEALGLWRGPAYGELVDTPEIREAAERLEEQRLSAIEQRIEAGMRLGRHRGLIDELSALVAQHPYREELRGHLMLALFRSGRQAEALEIYRRGRADLVEELGIEPGAALQRLHERILNSDPDLIEAEPADPVAGTEAGPVTVPAQLPSGITTFTGRDGEVEAVLAAEMPVHCVDGMAGSGKTTLAVHIAHRLVPRFPDGQLFIDLHGFSGQSHLADAGEALTRMLHGLGVSPAQVPGEVEDRAAMYRSTLAGRRMLIVLDNAADEEQVRPLLPGDPECLVLVTSRRRLAGLDEAHHVTLGLLSPAEAVELFTRIVGAERLDEQSADLVVEVMDLCGRLPLAVRIAASRLQQRRHWDVRDLWNRLSNEERRLAELGVGDRRVATAFEMSYQELNERQRRMFRLCALNPAPDFSVSAAAALTGTDPAEAADLLDDLIDVHLLHPSGRHRYTYHDLLRIFARERAHRDDGAEVCAAATGRFLEWMARSARAAAVSRRPARQSLPVAIDHPDIAPQEFTDPEATLDWFATEEQSLSSVIHAAGDHVRPLVACQIIDAMRGYFFHRVDRLKWRHLGEIGLAIAREHDNPVAEAAMCHSLGLAATLQGEYASGIGWYDHGVALTHRTGDEHRRVELLLCLAGAHSQTGAHQATAESTQEAIELTRRHDNLMLAGALHMLGVTCWESGDLVQAARHLQEAVVLDRNAGQDTLDDILSTLSIVYTDLGMLNSALSCAQESLELGEAMESVHSQASALHNLAGVHLERGHLAQAEAVAVRALRLAVESKLEKHEAFASLNLGLARLDAQPTQARDLLARCHATACELDMGMTQIEALIGLSQARRRLRDPAGAVRAAMNAIEVARQVGMPLAEAKALTELAAAKLDLGDPDGAGDAADRALLRHVESSHLLGEARTRLVLSRIRAEQGRSIEADTLRAAATRIFRQVGAPSPVTIDQVSH